MLVYKLVKVNPTTLRFVLLRAMTGTNVNITKKQRVAKKNRANNCATKTGTVNVTRTALQNRFAIKQTQTVPARHRTGNKIGVKRGFLRRLWITHLISTG